MDCISKLVRGGLTIELVDQSGATLKTTVKGFKDLKMLKAVTVKGTLVVKGGTFILKVSEPGSMFIE
jgi:hypothetical protein